MKRILIPLLLLAPLCALILTSCNGGKKKPSNPVQAIDYKQVATPTFNADSAYLYVQQQLQFGFRAPGHAGHDKCATFLINTMSRWADTVIAQPFTTTLWDGTNARGTNIIASFNRDAITRVLLAAHWDSRLWADHDATQSKQHTPLLGANDGASGVAVLMEVARALKQQRPEIGVDIIFFDLEDQGVPEWAERHDDDTWCKGAQHWSANPHKPYYQARYGILLDMVGTDNPRFTKEAISMQYASTITNRVWDIAHSLGYGAVFENTQSDAILDDHFYVNRLRGIPMVDIVQNSPRMSFFTHWHTTTDNLDNVNSKTLAIVGDVVLKAVYSTK